MYLEANVKILGLITIFIAIAISIAHRFAHKFKLLPRKKRELTIDSILNPVHYWAEADHLGFYHCCVCKKDGWNLFKVRFNECLICGSIKHRSCKEDSKVKCKAMTSESEKCEDSHQWVTGNLPLNIICDVCGVICGSVYGLEASMCVWCQRVVHENCLKKTKEVCDFGKLSEAIIRPSDVKVTRSKSSDDTTITTGKDTPKSQEENLHSANLKCAICPGTKTPIVAIINKRSGGLKGAKILAACYKLLNPIQVIDLIDEGLDRLNDFKSLENLKLLVGGGDGTISLVIDKIKRDIQTSSETDAKFKVPIAILPLGTGNDLSRSLGWGPGMTVPDAQSILLDVLNNSEPVLLDRWNVIIEDLANDKDQKIVQKTMLNYLGIGLDAKIALDFQTRRDKYPYLFKNRFGNKLIYTELGTHDLIFGNTQMLSEAVTLTCDGEEISLEGLQGIVILNIDYWGGGVYNIWGDLKKKSNDEEEDKAEIALNEKPEQEFKKPSICDGIIEVVGFHNAGHLGKSQMRLAKGIRICQGSKIEITVTEKELLFPIQIDGEPAAIKSPFKITLDTVEKVNMLTRRDYKRLQNESRIVKVLDRLELSKEITPEQKELLTDELIKELST